MTRRASGQAYRTLRKTSGGQLSHDIGIPFLYGCLDRGMAKADIAELCGVSISTIRYREHLWKGLHANAKAYSPPPIKVGSKLKSRFRLVG